MGQYFATVARGLETLAAEELVALGAHGVEPQFCGVAFQGHVELLYRVNLWARLPFRILVHLAQVPCQDAKALYQGIQRLDWSAHLTPAETLAVRVTGKNRQLNHSHFTALQVKNAIVDQQRHYWGRRSSVDVQTADVQANVHIQRQQAIVSLDSSGRSLHRRGYRPAVGAAPLKESLAAALVRLTGWQGDVPLLDPLCGSGTLPLEAALQALDVAPGLLDSTFGFQRWPDFDANLWQALLQEAQARRRPSLPVPILGCDRNSDVIRQARHNAQACGLADQVRFFQQALATLDAPADQGIILCNPPYGERMGHPAELADFYRLLGDVLKQRFKGWTAFILSGNKELARHIGLKSAQRFPVYNGSLPCQWMKYELY
ncbi:Putative RNA methyltransferase [Halomicronema hongdechloris C2206]|uniref:RNA methyltransferase n=1 Tax=Halomicronema hongdechloris C2206 TaxID=1641165 RepID=A0A1Z3HV44_9CYAN|nr:THUMP domain-containing protein [Halomicronema hongdechloris]ASC74174.1 Putative RNA methyltransferase [Halomicronema hongdechloris C2206]